MSNRAVPCAGSVLRPRWLGSLGLGLSLGLCVGTASAQAAPPLAAGLQACAAVAEPGARLACFDELAKRSLGHAGSAAAPAGGQVQPQAQTQAQSQAQARFGATVPPSAEPDSLESHITGEFDGWEPGSVFRLANGQRWRVADGTRGVLIARDPRIVIRRAAMGSFLLEFVGQNRAVRVRRVD